MFERGREGIILQSQSSKPQPENNWPRDKASTYVRQGSMTASMGMVLDLVVAVPCEGNAI